jgi:hypothetical protein
MIRDEGFQGVFCAGRECDYHFVDERPEDLVPPRDPCPLCGSTVRKVKMQFSLEARHHASLGLRAIPAGRGKRNWFYRHFEGWDWSSKFQKLMHKISTFDKRNRDRYWRYERVVDPATGEVVHLEDHDLREHIGHGSDKQKPREPKTNDTNPTRTDAEAPQDDA